MMRMSCARKLGYAILALSVFASVALCESTTDQDIIKQVQSAKTIYQQNLTAIEADFLDVIEKCLTAYAATLSVAEDTATGKGDLDAVVSIRKERARFAKDRALDDNIPPGTHPVLAEAMNAYLKNIEAADARKAANSAALSSKYMNYLESLKISLTKNKRIEEALTVDKAIRQASSDPRFNRALSEGNSTEKADVCPSCSGLGTVRSACQQCKSTGNCIQCEGTGIIKTRGFNDVLCSACKGTRKCLACNGSKIISQSCPVCKKPISEDR